MHAVGLQITFGPTNSTLFCKTYGFSINIDNIDRHDAAKTITRSPVNQSAAGHVDCNTFSASTYVSLLAELQHNDVISLRTLFHNLTIWRHPKYSHWGIIQL